MTVSTIFLIVILVAFACVIAIAIHKSLQKNRNKLPILRVTATITKKRTEEDTQIIKGNSSVSQTNYLVSFDLGDGRTYEFATDQEFYESDNIGKSGILSYKGSVFLGFSAND